MIFLFNKLFKNKNKRKSVIPQIYKRFNINNINKEDEEQPKRKGAKGNFNNLIILKKLLIIILLI